MESKLKFEPKISVVTVCYNAVATLENTILSVLNQTYSNIEYIVIDGGSKDGTIDIIKKYEERLTYWKSEPDKGIYDAMNKGIAVATGEWINFMNAGDTFCDSKVIESLFTQVNAESDVIYGDTRVYKTYGSYIEKPRSLESIKREMPFCHQSTFVKTRHMSSNKFDTRFRIVADYNLFYTLYSENLCFQHIPLPVANYEAISGVSTAALRRLKEERKVNNMSWTSYLINYANLYIRENLKRYLPDMLSNYLQKRSFDKKTKNGNEHTVYNTI